MPGPLCTSMPGKQSSNAPWAAMVKVFGSDPSCDWDTFRGPIEMLFLWLHGDVNH